LYATEGTQKAFAKEGIEAILLHKMYENLNPNLEDLLSQNRFDVIFHEEYDKTNKSQIEDAQVIRKWAVKTESKLITDYDVAVKFVDRLVKKPGKKVNNGKKEGK
jgi:hypothetical protein